MKDLRRVMEKLTKSLKPEILIDGKQVFLTASMGASIYPNHGKQMEQLMKAADIALYQVKDVYSGSSCTRQASKLKGRAACMK